MITILCAGSRGDIQPYIALAQALKGLGKEARIASGVSFRAFVEGYGIDFDPLSADYQTVDVDPVLLQNARTSDNPIKMLLTFQKMKHYAKLMTEEMYAACQNSEAVVYHPGCTVGYFAAEKLGIPSILATPFPLHRTAETASVITYGRYAVPKKFSYTLLQSMLWTASKSGVSGLWKDKFGANPSCFGCPFERVDTRHPAIVSCSNYVFKRPNDWSEHIHQHGYWFPEETEAYVPTDALRQFLSAGEAPLYFGFGSVFEESDKARLVAVIARALELTKKRGILSGMGKVDGLPSSMMAVDSIPHSWFFGHVAAVCHHGGAGTTAAGFRAGIPSIIVPFSNDQFAWAHRAFDLGVGSKPLSRKSLTAEALAEAIRFAGTDKVRDNAAALGKRIAAENGAAACAKVIADCMSA